MNGSCNLLMVEKRLIMRVELTHPAIFKVKSWDILLEGCDKLSTFSSRINRFAEQISSTGEHEVNGHYELSGSDAANKFKGDVFEVFCECLIRMSPIDDRIGISDYQVVSEGDTGVDGYGVNRSGQTATVQIKYRLWDYELKHARDHLDNFRLTSYTKFSVPPDAKDRMLIITTGKGIHWDTLDRQFLGMIRCVSNDASYGCIRGAQRKTIDSLFSLKTLVNDNIVFWDAFRKGTQNAASRL